MKDRVGIFGGSFDPVHNGHVQLAKSFLSSGLIHKLLVLLTPAPPHKQDQEKTSYDDRLAMLKLAYQDFENVEVSTLEQRLPSPSYTLQTIDHLQIKHSDTLFYLCMGEDSLVHFHEWYKYREILKSIDLIVAERPGYDRSSVSDDILESVIFVDHQPVDASSTEVRQAFNNSEKEYTPGLKVPEPVQKYIEDKGLYRSS